MRMTQSVQFLIRAAEISCDPCARLSRTTHGPAGIDHGIECAVEGERKPAASTIPVEAARNVQAAKSQNGSLRRAEPEKRRVLHRPREYSLGVGPNERAGIVIVADPDDIRISGQTGVDDAQHFDPILPHLDISSVLRYNAAMSIARQASVTRRTAETDITLSVDLDGDGQSEIDTGVGFLDHMLAHVARHGLLHLVVEARGDLHIDDHHTVEDIGIVLGQALRQAVADKAGISRYGYAVVPMDEALVACALDWSGRGLLVEDFSFSSDKIGTFDTELVSEFFRAIASNAGMTLHMEQRRGANAHHVAEAAFKAFGRAVDVAKRIDERVGGIPSTKGVL
jgi:imidazoleglycerol-phosphate dehydratase